MAPQDLPRETVASTCRACAGPLNDHWQVTDAKSAEPMRLGTCADCSLVQQLDIPSEEALHIYYAHHYRQDYKSTHQPRLKHVHRAGGVALDRLDRMAAMGVQARGQHLLDIGAGGGEFCFMAQQQGFAVRGIEPHEGYSEFARAHYGVRIDTCGLADIPAQSADVVTMFHVLEHLANPQQVAEKVWQVLRHRGLWVIEVPNLLQTDASPHNIYFKAHLFYYARQSLRAATSRHFEVLQLHDQGNLFAVLARRETPLERLQLPTAQELAQVRQQLAAKGWWTYLTVGGGWRRPWQRARRWLQERQLPSTSARDLLEMMHARPRQTNVRA